VNPGNGPEPDGADLPYKRVIYSFDYAGCHFVQLNSNYWYTSKIDRMIGNRLGPLLEQQLSWLENDLNGANDRQAKHIFVFVHAPPFPNGRHVQGSLWRGGEDPDVVAVRDRFWSAASEAGVVAVFSGHEHNYSRTLIDANTPVYVTGGSNHRFRNP